jgi:endonuclease/exonuclease/phosphatase (EEP) superfamily protein YafD
VVASATALAPAVDHWHWTIALAVHFPLQGLVLALLLSCAWASLRPRRAWVGLTLVTTIVLNVNAMAPQFAERAPTSTGSGLRVLCFNTWPHNPHTTDIWDYVAEVQPDIAVLFETSEALLSSSSSLADRYRTTTVDEFIVLISHDIEASVDSMTRLHRGVAVNVVHLGRRLQLVAAHPYPAISDDLELDATTTFEQLEDYCRRASAPVAIVGDLNTTPWSSRFQQLLENGQLVDSLLGRGLQLSFPAWPPVIGLPFGIPIDHCLHSADLLCTSRELGSALGSNHHPLIVELAWPET